MNDSLYHYTGLETFKRIISEGLLRANHYQRLGGDTREIEYGVAEFRRALEVHPVLAQDEAYKAFLLEQVDHFIRGPLEVYVSCFSSSVDSEWHWREYVRSPPGVAIGFDATQVRDGFRTLNTFSMGSWITPNPRNRYLPCIYEGQFQMAQLVADRFFKADSYPAMFRAPPPISTELLYSGLSVSIYRFITSIKRTEYEQDREARLFCINPESDGLEVVWNAEERYINLSFIPVDSIREVWIGPGSQQEECRRVIQDFIDEGRLKCEIRMSGYPQPIS